MENEPTEENERSIEEEVRPELVAVQDEVRSSSNSRRTRGVEGNNLSEKGGSIERVGDPLCKGLEGHPGDVTDVEKPGRFDSQEAGSAPEAGSILHREAVDGFWRGVDWVEDRDGNWRPIQPGLEPMADGTPNRMGRCRTYGNAIVSEVAKEVIRSYMDL